MPIIIKTSNFGTEKVAILPGRFGRGLHFDRAIIVLAPVIKQLQAAGILDVRKLADCLNKGGILAPNGGNFTYGSTRRILRRLKELSLATGPRTRATAARQRAHRPYTFRPSKASRTTTATAETQSHYPATRFRARL